MQIGVMRGAGLGLLTALAFLVLASTNGMRLVTVGSDLSARATLAAWSLVLPSLALLVCIARLAMHRFFTPADINGSGLTDGTAKAKLLQALLQNTLEQCCLALPVYIAASLLAPAALLPVVPVAAGMFLVGRLLFFAGYAKGAPSRAFGFALTFYPTALLLLFLIAFGAWKLAV